MFVWRIFTICIVMCTSLCAIAQERSNGILYIYARKGYNIETGTGFFVNSEGAFVTAYHVINGATSADVYDPKNKKYSSVQLISSDSTNDIAVLTVNDPTTNYFTFDDQAPKVGTVLSTIGHPWGLRDQTFRARTTQNGYADSLSLFNADGKGIYTKSVTIIPLDVTIYNGMSGAPLLNAGGNVIGMLSGSFNVGGSLAWGIPSKQILSLITPMPTTRTDLANVIWRPMDGFSTAFRGFVIPRNLGDSETIDWLNTKWQTRGVKEFGVNDFIAHITDARLTFDDATKSLVMTTLFGLTGKTYRTQITISLEDALSASAEESSGSGYHVVVECPKERSCTSYERQIFSANSWKAIAPGKRTNRVDTEDVWEMVDQDGAARAAMAINHLIQLHGAPVYRLENFAPK